MKPVVVLDPTGAILRIECAGLDAPHLVGAALTRQATDGAPLVELALSDFEVRVETTRPVFSTSPTGNGAARRAAEQGAPA